MREIEIGSADVDSMKKYGASVMRPAKVEANMMTLSAADARMETSFRLRYSWADCSEGKLPMAMENASTKMSTMPVRTICARGTAAHSNTGEEGRRSRQTILDPKYEVSDMPAFWSLVCFICSSIRRILASQGLALRS